MKPFKIGIDSYSLKPLGLSPFEILDWAIMNDAEGVQFSDGSADPGHVSDRAFFEELASYAAQNNLYLEWGGGEYIPVDPTTGKSKDILTANRKAAEQARLLGATTVRSTTGGLTRRHKKLPFMEDLLRMTAKSLKEHKQMLRDFGVVLALENQFVFTTSELLRLFEMCDARPGENIGLCLDTMNLLTLLEDPVAAANRILPWVVTTHIKDGAVLMTEDGLVVFPVEAGTGVVDFSSIFEMFSGAGRTINLSLEDHGGEFHVALFDPGVLAGFPDLTTAEMSGLIKLSLEGRRRLDEGRIAIVDRQHWPDHCERRVKRGLRALKRIVDKELK